MAGTITVDIKQLTVCARIMAPAHDHPNIRVYGDRSIIQILAERNILSACVLLVINPVCVP